MRPPRRTPSSGPPHETSAPVRGRRAHAGLPADEDVLVEPEPHNASPARGGAMHLRPRTVRAKIICLLMVPVVSLLALWAFATVSTAQDVARLRQLQRVDETVRTPVGAAVAALQAERTAAVAYATEPTAGRGDTLTRRAATTDRVVSALRIGNDGTVADGADLPRAVVGRLESFVGGVEHLRSVRKAVQERRTGWDDAYGQYTRTVDSAFAVSGSLTGIQDSELGSDARVLLEFGRSGRCSPGRTRCSSAHAWPVLWTVSGCGCSPGRWGPAGT